MNRIAAATAATLMPCLLLLAGCGGAAVPEGKDVSVTAAFTDVAAATAVCPALFGEANVAAKNVFGQDIASEWQAHADETSMFCALMPIGAEKSTVALFVSLTPGMENTEIVSKSGAAIGYRLTDSMKGLTQEQGKKFQEWLTKAVEHVKV